MKKISILLVGLLFMGLGFLQAQGGNVSGTVTSSEDGMPIPGVSVVVTGTNTGITTNIDGNYSLDVPADATTLTFSFVGMKTQVVDIGGRTTINVVLEPEIVGLDEVVVTALGISRSSKSVGYSATTVSSDEITKTRASDIMSGVAGKIAGVQVSSSSSDPGASNSVIVRGVSSLGGNNQPLYVVDGVPIVNNATTGADQLNNSYDFGNAANLINPDDVETMTILKGAAATSLYGSRAANGVILVTTKKGIKGQNNVTFNSSVEFSDILRLPEFQNDFGMGWDAHHTLIENGSWGPRFDDQEHLWGNVYNNSQKLKKFSPKEDNIADFFEIGQKYSNSLSLSGGSEKTTYYSSLSYVKQDGLIPDDIDQYNKYTAKLTATHDLGKLRITSSLNYSQQENAFAPTGQGLSIINSLYQTPRDISIVSLADYETDPFDNVDYYYTPYGITNPYYLRDNIEASFEQKKVFGKMQFDYNIAEGFSAMYRFGIDASDNVEKMGVPEVQAAVGTPNENASTNQEGTVTKTNRRRHEYNHDAFLNYERSLDFMTFSILGGVNVNERNYSFLSSSVTGLDIPGFYDLSNSSSQAVINEYYEKRRLVGALANVELSFYEMLFVTLNARNDWSSTLPKDNNSFFYSGVATSFLFSELLPESTSNILDYGKIRVAWGQTGNDTDPYQIAPSFVQSSIYNPFRNLNFPLNGQNAFEVGNQLGNAELVNELTTEFEVGVDLKLFQNRLGIDVAYYDRTSNEQIFALALAPSTGYTTQTTNLGEISNKGIELLLKLTPIRTGNFSWDILTNFSTNKNELVSLPEELGGKVNIGGLNSVGYVAQVGKPIGLFEVTVPELTSDGKIVVVKETGRPAAAAEKEIIEKSDYDYMLGVTNSLSYNGLVLTFDIDIRQGGLMYSRTKDINYFTGNSAETTYNSRHTFIVPNSVVEVTDDDGNVTGYEENTTPISQADMDDYFADGAELLDRAWLIDRSFVKLRRLALSYSLPGTIISKTPFKGVTVTAYGNNLLLFTPEDNSFIDPEVTTFGNDIERGFGEFSANPSTRSWGLNLKLNF